MKDLIHCSEKCIICNKSHSTENEFIQCAKKDTTFLLKWYVGSSQELSEKFLKIFSKKLDWYDISIFQNFPKSFIEKVLIKLNNPKFNSKYYIEKYVEEIEYDIEFAIKRNEYQKQYKKHIMSILQEDKIYLTEEFKNQLLTIILSET
jgi:hypothetical protein